MSDAAPTAPPPLTPTPIEESRRRIRDALMHATRVAVGTHAGEEVRVRMMHPGAWLPDDEAARPLVYLASMKSDPKIRDAVARATFEHLIGFQLTQEQLRYNATR